MFYPSNIVFPKTNIVMQQAGSAVMKANEMGDIAFMPMPSADKGLLTDKCEIPKPEKKI